MIYLLQGVTYVHPSRLFMRAIRAREPWIMSLDLVHLRARTLSSSMDQIFKLYSGADYKGLGLRFHEPAPDIRI